MDLEAGRVDDGGVCIGGWRGYPLFFVYRLQCCCSEVRLLVSAHLRFIMDVTRLAKDELIHEVGIRGHKVEADVATVDALRKTLRDLLAKEANGDVLEDALLPVDVEGEMLLLGAKLISVEELLSEQPGIIEAGLSTADGMATKIRTLTSHCNKRLVRLLTNCPADCPMKLRNGIKAMFRKLKELVEKFRSMDATKAVYAASSVLTVSEEKSEHTAGSGSESSDSDGSKAQSKSSHSSKPKRERHGKKSRTPPVVTKALDLHKWNIKFSGKEEESVISFLQDVEEKAAWKGVELNYLVAGATEFFEGRAKTWFRTERAKLDSWSELKVALRREFLPLDYYDNLWEEVRTRKQGVSEPMGAYVSNVMALFERLEIGEPVKDEVKLRYLLKNVAPFYAQHLALTNVLSITHLKELGRKLEVGKMRAEGYDGKTKKKMEPEFALKSSQYRRPVVNALSAEPPVVPVVVKQVEKPAKESGSKVVCYRCEEPGHIWSKCASTNPEHKNKRFCYRCGDVAHFAKDCTKRKPVATAEKKAGEA